MKFNNFYLVRNICIISVSVFVLACSSVKHNRNDYKINQNISDLDDSAITNNYAISTNEIQSKIKNLKSINTIYFPLDRYHILSEFFSVLDIHAEFLCNNPLYQIRIEGHTDERGTPEYNIALGERRAYSVKNYLQSKGVLSNQIKTVSYGKEKPICFDHTEEAYSKNRRVILSY